MVTINIDEEVNTHDDVAQLLRHIADLIDQGYLSGYYPTWQMAGDEEVE